MLCYSHLPTKPNPIPVALDDPEVTAMSLVTISIVGNLVKPPEQIYFASGRVKTTMVVAVNGSGRGPRAAEIADFYRVEIWGKLAEAAGKYLSKGNQVGVSGRLILDRWTDKQGRSRITPIVEATQMAFPPRLKVVPGDDQAAEHSTGVNPIGGAVVFNEADGEEDTDETTDDTAYGSPPDAEPEPVPPTRRSPQTA